MYAMCSYHLLECPVSISAIQVIRELHAGLIKNLPRIEDIIGVDRAFECAHHVQAGLAGKPFQKFLLRQADAMFAGDGAAKSDGFFKNLTKSGVDALDFLRVALVAEKRRMQIAVAEVTEDADAQLVYRGGLLDKSD